MQESRRSCGKSTFWKFSSRTPLHEMKVQESQHSQHRFHSIKEMQTCDNVNTGNTGKFTFSSRILLHEMWTCDIQENRPYIKIFWNMMRSKHVIGGNADAGKSTLLSKSLLHESMWLESIQLGIRKRPTYRFEDTIVLERWYFWRSEINID